MIEAAKTLRTARDLLEELGYGHALVGGLAVSIRSEVRFTRDVDFAISVASDEEAEQVVFALSRRQYRPVTMVEHQSAGRLATARLRSPEGITVDLLFASTGIEPEIVKRATIVDVPGLGDTNVARAEELLAMKILSMSAERLQDRMDAQNLLLFNQDIHQESVRENLRLITAREYHRGKNLLKLLEALVAELSL